MKQHHEGASATAFSVVSTGQDDFELSELLRFHADPFSFRALRAV